MPSLSRLIVALTVQPASACTYFEVRSPVAGVPMVIGNSLEWFEPSSGRGYHAAVHRRGRQQIPTCVGGQQWESKLGLVMIQDGSGGLSTDLLNEAGLSVSAHAIRGVSTYTPDNITETHCASDLLTWIGGTFKKVEDLRAVLPSVKVIASGRGTISEPGNQWAIADAFGSSIVVDYVDGNLHIHDNSGVGVMTNDPEYSWHLRNLNNYVGLQAGWPDANDNLTCDSEIGQVPVAVGHGQNLLGLPGDVTPASRFVRTFFMRNYAMKATPPADVDEALVLANGVLNSQYIVKGFNAKLPSEKTYDFTILNTLKVPEQGLIFYRTYEDSQWRKVNLTAIDFDRSGSSKPSQQKFGSLDVTGEILSSADGRSSEDVV